MASKRNINTLIKCVFVLICIDGENGKRERERQETLRLKREKARKCVCVFFCMYVCV